MSRTEWRRIAPAGVRQRARPVLAALGRLIAAWRLARLRSRLFALPSNPNRLQSVGPYHVRITDGPNFYMQYKDEFLQRIYHFDARRSDPLIIDGGSNMGMSILYFKMVYPQARIIGFEPDPAIYRLLQENVTRGGLQNVTLVNAGLAARSGQAAFLPDGTAGGRLGARAGGITVRMEPLSAYLDEPVDFLKLNIEGEELPVLQEAAASGKLGMVHELVLEYHGWPDGAQRLGPILDLLDAQGFRYLVHDFDAETCPASKPPFRLKAQTPWFCLVYARRAGDHD